jgi:hypothetical protein
MASPAVLELGCVNEDEPVRGVGHDPNACALCQPQSAGTQIACEAAAGELRRV